MVVLAEEESFVSAAQHLPCLKDGHNSIFDQAGSEPAGVILDRAFLLQ
jgi:hypothetical protein